MSKYTDASRYYREMLRSWELFARGIDKTYHHNNIVNHAIAIAKLGLPDPFEGKQDPEEQALVEHVAETKPAVEEKTEAEEKPAADEPEEKPVFQKPQWSNAKRHDFKRR